MATRKQVASKRIAAQAEPRVLLPGSERQPLPQGTGEGAVRLGNPRLTLSVILGLRCPTLRGAPLASHARSSAGTTAQIRLPSKRSARLRGSSACPSRTRPPCRNAAPCNSPARALRCRRRLARP